MIVNIKFHNDVIEVYDGLVSVRKICENLGIDRASQFAKIKAEKVFEGKIIDVKINGVTQNIFVIPYEKVQGWLFTISTAKVKPEVREKLIEYKNEAFKVLHDYFNNGYAMKPEIKAELEALLQKQNETIANLHKKLEQKPQIENKRNYITTTDATHLIDEMKYHVQEQMEMLLKNSIHNLRGIFDTCVISNHRKITELQVKK